MAAPAYNDGTVQYGSLVIGVNAVTYVADNFSVNRGTKDLRRTNQIGEPSGSVGINDFVVGSATLQLAASGTAEPLVGGAIKDAAAASLILDATIGAEDFFITSVGRALVKDGEKKINISFIKKYN